MKHHVAGHKHILGYEHRMNQLLDLVIYLINVAHHHVHLLHHHQEHQVAALDLADHLDFA